MKVFKDKFKNHLLFYGCGAIAFGVKANGFNYLLLYFYSQVMGLPPEKVSFGLAIALIIDAITDPLIGAISDNFKSKFGRRHLFIYVFGLPAGISYYFLWSPPQLDPDTLFYYFIGLTVLTRFLMTFYEVPSVALGPELSLDYDNRTKLSASRYLFGWWGGLTMATLVYLVFLPEENGGLNYLEGWSKYGLTASCLIVVSIYCSGIGLHSEIPNLPKASPKQKTAKEILIYTFQAISNKQFIALFTSASFFAMAAGITMSLGIYFTRHFWELETSEIGLLQLPLFFSAVLASVIAPRFSQILDKKKCAVICVISCIVVAPIPFLLRFIDFFPQNSSEFLVPTLMVFSFIETCLAIMASIYFSAMFADIVEDNEKNNSQRSEGLYYAASSFTQKALNSFGILLAGQILKFVNFPQGSEVDQIAPNIITNLVLASLSCLAVIYSVAVSLLFFYNISRETHKENLKYINNKQNIAET